MNFIQTTLQVIEVGKGQILVRIIPLLATLLIVGGAYDMIVYHGLSDAQSMDNAQLARQIVRGQGFTTEFLRPQAVAQLRDYAISQSLQNGKTRDLFPSDQFPPGTPRILPDTYNAPGYPCLLATWFYFIHPEFDQVAMAMSTSHIYSADRFIPLLNQVFMLMTALLVFALGRRLFDDRVAWISMLAFLGTDLVWHYTLTALSTNVLMFLITAMALELRRGSSARRGLPDTVAPPGPADTAFRFFDDNAPGQFSVVRRHRPCGHRPGHALVSPRQHHFRQSLGLQFRAAALWPGRLLG
jgi:hypothetical protein